MIEHNIREAPLGKKSTYHSEYQADLLFPVSRHINRNELGITTSLPFYGKDIWNAFEVSWLNPNGKPIVAVAELIIPITSPNLIESKSLKLYLNSFNNTSFDSFETVQNVLQNDLSHVAGEIVSVKLFPLKKSLQKLTAQFAGLSIDDIDVNCDTYFIQPGYLSAEGEVVTEILHSDLLKSNCLVTGQPDWGSVQISYTGKQINHPGLLKYIVSFRNHNEFHEHCVERIFMDITKYCQPEKLLVYARYTRRGGLDINPYRANYRITDIENIRLFRQ